MPHHLPLIELNLTLFQTAMVHGEHFPLFWLIDRRQVAEVVLELDKGLVALFIPMKGPL